jgi:hypothetical protein
MIAWIFLVAMTAQGVLQSADARVYPTLSACEQERTAVLATLPANSPLFTISVCTAVPLTVVIKN